MKRKRLDIKAIEVEGPRVEATITTETIDRDGEVLISQGMDATSFERNPQLFYNHDWSNPIGNALDLRRSDRQIDATLVFAQRPDDWGDSPYFPKYVESLVTQGVVRGVSIGFQPKDDGVRKATDVDRKQYGDKVHTIYSKWDLMEVSIAPLPANPRALVTAVTKGAVDRAAAKAFAGVEAPRRIQIVVPDIGRLSKLSETRIRADRRKA